MVARSNWGGLSVVSWVVLLRDFPNTLLGGGVCSVGATGTGQLNSSMSSLCCPKRMVPCFVKVP